jgi:membrane protein DedA with SNARE-associated domain
MDPLQHFIDCIALYGALGLFLIALAERFVPALPSHGVLVAIGIAAIDGVWSVPTAVFATTGGSFGGCLALYIISRRAGHQRTTRVLYRASNILGISRDRVDSTVASFQAREQLFLLMAQLIPTVRLGAPLIAAILKADSKRFVAGTALGIAFWNALFISVGYMAVVAVPWMSASHLALKVLVLLLVVQTLAVLLWRYRNKRAGSR